MSGEVRARPGPMRDVATAAGVAPTPVATTAAQQRWPTDDDSLSRETIERLLADGKITKEKARELLDPSGQFSKKANPNDRSALTEKLLFGMLAVGGAKTALDGARIGAAYPRAQKIAGGGKIWRESWFTNFADGRIVPLRGRWWGPAFKGSNGLGVAMAASQLVLTGPSLWDGWKNSGGPRGWYDNRPGRTGVIQGVGGGATALLLGVGFKKAMEAQNMTVLQGLRDGGATKTALARSIGYKGFGSKWYGAVVKASMLALPANEWGFLDNRTNRSELVPGVAGLGLAYWMLNSGLEAPTKKAWLPLGKSLLNVPVAIVPDAVRGVGQLGVNAVRAIGGKPRTTTARSHFAAAGTKLPGAMKASAEDFGRGASQLGKNVPKILSTGFSTPLRNPVRLAKGGAIGAAVFGVNALGGFDFLDTSKK